MGRRKLHKSEKERQEAAKRYRKVYYEKNKVVILEKMQLKYNTMKHPHTILWNSKSNDTGDSDLTRLFDPEIKFRKLVNGSTHRFLDDLALQYMGSTHSEDSRRPILDALNIAQEAEEAIKRSGGDGVITLNPHNKIQRERKMVASEWTSKEQKEWLIAQLPGYQKCSTKSSYAKFWPPIYEQWEQQWPIYKELWPELPDEDGLNAVQLAMKGKAVKRRQKQLCTWMSWHSGNSTSRKGRVAQSSARATCLLKDLLQPRGSRALTEAEMYSRLYYKTNIHPTVEAARETDETVIADVKARMKAKKKSKKVGTDEDVDALEDEDEEQSPTTEDMLEAQENLPAIFNTILTYLEQTGFSFLVLMGGPDPSNNNKLSVASVDVGTTKLGHSAPQLLPDFKENFLGTYLKFLQDVQGKVLHLHDNDVGYSSPEPETKGDADGEEAADEGEAEDGDHTDLEDQDEVDADPFADELEEEIEVLQRQDNRINMHGFLQPEDQANLTMHDANPYFANSTNFHSTDAHSADLSLLLNNPQLWTFTPAPIEHYNLLQNFNSFNHFNPVPSYPQPLSYPQPSSGHLSHPSIDTSDALPLLPRVATGNSPPSPLDGLPPLPPAPVPTPSLLDGLPALPPVPTGNPPSSPEGLPQKVAGGKASNKAKCTASTSQSEPTTRKSRRPPKPSTRNETTNAIGANSLSEMREKENTATMVGKKAHKHGLDAGGEPIAKKKKVAAISTVQA
ncbi:hypothetical protein EV702DRAFT_1043405 [Suillus placidus]|uniref:Uncharacterized protein n=1 Tax=Suillus placidus TaxID=48579 RepID=A0A9P7A1K0_9AGAM|nr:hypothetical protein EV702DRAFT_1043405 [Suillus placidus]